MEEKTATFPHLRWGARSDIGRRRTNNEDAFGLFPEAGCFVVSDGMGGGDDGEVASDATVRAVEAFCAAHPPPPERAHDIGDWTDGVCHAVDTAAAWIYGRAKERKLKGCGATFVCVCFDAARPQDAVALHAGDSRVYRLRGRSIRQMTRDHSAAQLIGAKDDRDINPLFRGVILRAVGTEPRVDVERTPLPVKAGDRILLCSDGLSRMVSDRRILAVSRAHAAPDAAASALVDAANAAGGVDNVTAVVIDVGALPPPPAVRSPAARAEAGSAARADAAAATAAGCGRTLPVGGRGGGERRRLDDGGGAVGESGCDDAGEHQAAHRAVRSPAGVA